MTFKHHPVSDVLGLRDDPNYARQFRGVKENNFQLAFFAFRNSVLCTTLGCWQLLHLYLAYLVLRVSLRELKRKGIDVTRIRKFTFRWGVKPEPDMSEESVPFSGDVGSLILELLNYSNVFNDY